MSAVALRALDIAVMAGAGGFLLLVLLLVIVCRVESDRRLVDAVRRDFVENAARELHTPLAGLAGLADTLAAERDPAVAARLADRISGQARRLTGVVDNLVDLSRVEVAEEPRREAV